MNRAVFSNGTDMMVFQDSWCARCRKERSCRIMDYLVINEKSRRIAGDPPQCLSFDDESIPKPPKPKKAPIDQGSLL